MPGALDAQVDHDVDGSDLVEVAGETLESGCPREEKKKVHVHQLRVLILHLHPRHGGVDQHDWLVGKYSPFGARNVLKCLLTKQFHRDDARNDASSHFVCLLNEWLYH